MNAHFFKDTEDTNIAEKVKNKTVIRTILAQSQFPQ